MGEDILSICRVMDILRAALDIVCWKSRFYRRRSRFEIYGRLFNIAQTSLLRSADPTICASTASSIVEHMDRAYAAAIHRHFEIDMLASCVRVEQKSHASGCQDAIIRVNGQFISSYKKQTPRRLTIPDDSEMAHYSLEAFALVDCRRHRHTVPPSESFLLQPLSGATLHSEGRPADVIALARQWCTNHDKALLIYLFKGQRRGISLDRRATRVTRNSRFGPAIA